MFENMYCSWQSVSMKIFAVWLFPVPLSLAYNLGNNLQPSAFHSHNPAVFWSYSTGLHFPFTKPPAVKQDSKSRTTTHTFDVDQ